MRASEDLTHPPDPIDDQASGWEWRWPPVVYWVKVALGVALTVAAIYQIRLVADTLLLLLIALVLAAGLDPAAEWFEQRGLSRRQAVAVIFGLGAAILIAFLALAVPAIARQLEGLSQDIPRYVARLEARDGWLGDFLARTDAVTKVQAFIDHLPQRMAESFGTVLGVAGKVGAAIVGAFIVAVLTGYLLASFPGLRRGIMLVLPPQHRVRSAVAIDRSIERVGAYVAGNVITSLVCTGTTVIALILIGVPFAIPLAIWAGVMDLLPIIGAYLGAAPAVAVAFFVSPATGIVTAVYFLVYQQIENYVLVPRVMRGAVHLSPASVILSTLLGASLAGIAGALLALPVAATIKVLVVEIWLHNRAVAGDPVARERFAQLRREEPAG